MKNKKLILTAVMAFLSLTAVTAQEGSCNKLKSYSFVEAQGGVQLTATDADMSKLLTPTVGLSLGHYFTPVVGARLHVNAWQAKSGFKDLDQYYKWKYVTPSADLLINLSNLMCHSSKHTLNMILLGGIGLNYAWDSDELEDMGVMVSRTPLAWKDNRLSHNIRAGLRLETDVTKPLGLSLEVAANSTDDRFNSKTNDQDDWQFTAMLGISYRFGKRYCQKCCQVQPVPVVVDPEPQPIVEPEPQPIVEPEPQPIVEPKPEPKPVVKKENLNEEIFYVICKSDPTVSGQDQMQRVADFMKKYKDAKVTIVGYADKGTGNPKINKMYAERRAVECKDVLVKKYGCDGSRIIIDSKGDTVQPFSENDKNRCVIIDSQAQYTTYE
jgi:outer membrane protein OmpA-like peptidoglycan-associated protein